MFYSDTFPQIIQSLWLSKGKMLSGFAIGHPGQRRVPQLVNYKNQICSNSFKGHSSSRSQATQTGQVSVYE